MSSHVQGIQISGWKRDATVTKCLRKQAIHTHTLTKLNGMRLIRKGHCEYGSCTRNSC